MGAKLLECYYWFTTSKDEYQRLTTATKSQKSRTEKYSESWKQKSWVLEAITQERSLVRNFLSCLAHSLILKTAKGKVQKKKEKNLTNISFAFTHTYILEKVTFLSDPVIPGPIYGSGCL